MTDSEDVVTGWVSAGKDRGSIDILWSSSITILLCCWAATYPNASAPSDRWYHAVIDKFNMAFVGLLGPDLLFGIALGQLSSAWVSVRTINGDASLDGARKRPWTLKHAHFVDMGALHLASPDFPQGFPINTVQLHYLVTNNFVDFPDMDALDIDERSKVDAMARFITAFQALWFLITQIQRFRIGLPMTTLELTAISFTLVMIVTSALWFRKPAIGKPQIISTRQGVDVAGIRAFAGLDRQGERDDEWFRTPLDFLGPRRFGIDSHWQSYVEVSRLLRVPIFSRPMTRRLWDRYPSDLWLCPQVRWIPLAILVQFAFSAVFLLAWNFHFPTYAEAVLWRVSAVYHAAWSLLGGFYYMMDVFATQETFARWTRRSDVGNDQDTELQALGSGQARVEPLPSVSPTGPEQQEKKSLWQRAWRRVVFFRNLSPYGDPKMHIPLRFSGPVALSCLLYIACRLYVYVEDFASLRAQPAGVYLTVNRFVPFLTGG